MEFKIESFRFFEEVRQGKFVLVVLEAEVVGLASSNDASHVAVATVYNVDLPVSWNFKHIVHFEKIRAYEGVNSLHGYRSPRIYSPREVITL